uniref:Small ribosomal subunit protein bS18c n=1 Tax=Erodium crassifolium TaxID=337368 RepID=A0A0A0PH24_9ROSI|nr:ribosomal protein S18 [Erodium crassifolium]AHH24715.1 ribosomal protein S18 [Erodium crassifolium]
MIKLNRLFLTPKPTLFKTKQKKKRSFLKKKKKPSFGPRLLPVPKEELINLNYRSIFFLSQFLSKQGKILARSVKGAGKKEHSFLTRAVKQARILAFFSFHASEQLLHMNETLLAKAALLEKSGKGKGKKKEKKLL